jgi:hypothetical protein
VGEGGGFGGGWVSNEQLVAYAMQDARNRAAAIGANKVQMGPPQLGVTGSSKGGMSTTSATVVGTAYRCPRHHRGTSGPDDEHTPSPPREAPPTGAAGFEFGQAVAEAQKACTAAGQEWWSDADRATCSGPAVDLGLPVHVALDLCDGAICRVSMIGAPATAEAYVAQVASLVGRMRAKYGDGTDKTVIPPECEGRIAACVRQQKIGVHVVWEWPSKYAITLRGQTGDSLAFSVAYDTPAWGRKNRPAPSL